jgi:type II secretion system protein G
MKCLLQTSLLFLFGISIPLLAGAQESLDPSFGNNGQLTTDFSIYDDNAHAITVQADGKILVAGQSENGADTDFAIARYHGDGSLDKDFNDSGQVTIQIGSGNDNGLALVVQDDGKILVAGTTDNGNDLDVAVIRLRNDGLPDMDFNEDGQVVIEIPDSDDTARSLFLQKDGKIVIAGSSEQKEKTQLFLARLNNNGSLDTTFANNGLVETTSKEDAEAFSAVLQEDGRILLAGFNSKEDVKRAALFSFLTNGQIEQTFGEQGIAYSGPEDSNSVFHDLAILEDGNILAAGATFGPAYRSILLAKFTSNGKVDPQFNGQGVVQSDLGTDSVAYGLAIAKDSSIYLAGSGKNDQDTDFILLHYSASGYAIEDTPEIVEEEEEEIDTGGMTFSPLEIRDSITPDQNYTLTDFEQYNDVARSIYIQEDGTILLAGSAENGKDSDFAVLRYSTADLAQNRLPNGTTTEGYYIATTPPANVTRNSATSGGFLENQGSSLTVDGRGVCYGITSAPGLKDFTTVADNDNITIPFKSVTVTEGCTSDGSGVGTFRSDILSVTPDTTYYVRAYTQLKSSGGTIINIYGNELQFTTEDACFIVTAATGSPDSIQVQVLRQFRDSFLKSSLLGKKLIQSYYHFSPPVAELISNHSTLQQGTRILLAPVTLLSYFALHPLFGLQLIAVLLLTAALFQFAMSHPTGKQNKMVAPNHARGFTLIELLVVLVIIGILAGYVGPRIMGHPEDAKRTMATAQMSALETALESYKLDNGTYPSTEQGLQALVEAPSVGKLPARWRKGGYLKKGKVPKDPWGNEYVYLSPGSHNDIDLISYGSDNESGGEDADADVNNWEIE